MNPTFDSHDPEERRAAALSEFLEGLRSLDDPALPSGEAQLAADLRLLAHATHLEPEYHTELGHMLGEEIPQVRRLNSVRRYGRWVAWAALTLFLVLGLSWAIPNLLPRPAVQPTPSVTGTVTPTATSPVATPPAATPTGAVTRPAATPLVTPTTRAVVPPAGSVLLPDDQLVVMAPFPTAPAEANLYEQPPLPPVDPAAGAALAARLGLPELSYQSLNSGAGQPPQLFFSDGFARLEISNTAWYYNYTVDGSVAADGALPGPLTPEKAAQVENFLKQHGFLDFPYKMDLHDDSPDAVNFVPLLDGLPVRFDSLGGTNVRAQVRANGQVAQVSGYLPEFKLVGRYPIINAVQAWQKIIAPTLAYGAVMYQGWHQERARVWQRTYPPGQPVVAYGRLETYQPPQGTNGAPLFFLDGVPLLGNLQGLLAAGQSQMVELHGSFQPGSARQRQLRVESWKISPLTQFYQQGTLQRKSDGDMLLAGNKLYRLPDVPAELPDGTEIAVDGVLLSNSQDIASNQPLVDWSRLSTGPFGGGGGGGGPSFSPLNLGGTPVPTPTPVPVETIPAGKKLDGVSGQAYLTIHQYPDGSRSLEAFLSLDDTPQFPGGGSLRLEGPVVEQLIPYHQLPIRAWGEFVGDTIGGTHHFRLDRFEPVYPDVKTQAWAGNLDIVTLEGKQVIRLITQDGEKYVLKSSLENLAPPDLASWLKPDELVVVEGTAFPDQSFGGLPVIRDLIFLPAANVNFTSLSEYHLKYASPGVVQEKGSASDPRQAVIDQIELVYYTTDQRWASGEKGVQPAYVEPAWRFVGHMQNGDPFVIFVQALQDPYLNPAAIFP